MWEHVLRDDNFSEYIHSNTYVAILLINAEVEDIYLYSSLQSFQ
jgi:hypothetical protein